MRQLGKSYMFVPLGGAFWAANFSKSDQILPIKQISTQNLSLKSLLTRLIFPPETNSGTKNQNQQLNLVSQEPSYEHSV